MPTYAFRCDSCNKEFDRITKIADREKPLEEPCPECEVVGKVQRVMTAPQAVVYGVMNFNSKVPDGFKDRLREMKKVYGHRSTIDV